VQISKLLPKRKLLVREGQGEVRFATSNHCVIDIEEYQVYLSRDDVCRFLAAMDKANNPTN
jgi:hypothetical protein